MSGRGNNFPPAGLADAILRVIAEFTGREVEASQVSCWTGSSIEVVAMLAEDGVVEVDFQDPMRSGGGG